MEEKLVLKVSIDENGNTVVDIPNNDEACMHITNYIWENIRKNDTGPLDVLFSIVVHMLAQNLDMRFEKQFINNLKETTPQYREGYRALRQQMMKAKS